MTISNKKAHFDYFISDEHSAGIVLKGLQVKAIRDGRVSLVGSHCYIGNKNDIWVNLPIAGVNTQVKLLLNKIEIKRLGQKVSAKGFTLVPLNIYMDRGMFKMKIALGKGKQNHDKRNSIKEKDLSRKMKQN